jgi:hypothetical protein
MSNLTVQSDWKEWNQSWEKKEIDGKPRYVFENTAAQTINNKHPPSDNLPSKNIIIQALQMVGTSGDKFEFQCHCRDWVIFENFYFKSMDK